MSHRGFSGLRPLWVAAILAVPCTLCAQVGTVDERRLDEATVEGVVSEHETDAPVSGATVMLVPTVDGTRVPGFRVTDDEGRFVFARVVPGVYVLSVQMIGFKPREDTLKIAEGMRTRVALQLSVSPVRLEPLSVEVVARRWRSYEMEMFEKRRSRLHGYFFDRDDILSRFATRVSDILRVVPNVAIANGQPHNNRGGGCPMPIFVDGVRTLEGTGIDLDIPPIMIEAIEVYTGLGQVPPQYIAGPCGAVLIWTGGVAPEPVAERKPGRLWKAFAAILAAGSLLWTVSR